MQGPRTRPTETTHSYKHVVTQIHRCERPFTLVHGHRDIPSHPCTCPLGDTDSGYPNTLTLAGTGRAWTQLTDIDKLVQTCPKNTHSQMQTSTHRHSHMLVDRHSDGPQMPVHSHSHPQPTPVPRRGTVTKYSHPDTRHTRRHAVAGPRELHAHRRAAQTAHLGSSYFEIQIHNPSRCSASPCSLWAQPLCPATTGPGTHYGHHPSRN